MSRSSDLNKSWIGAASRGTTTFNAPSSITITYGRYKGTVSGRGGSGNAPTAASYTINYNTNYNVAYPIATQPIANQPATTWSTNYNVAYPIATQPITAYSITYNTNYNVAYPIANQPETGRPINAYTILYNTNYNVAYPIATQPATAYSITYNTNYNVAYPIANQPYDSTNAVYYYETYYVMYGANGVTNYSYGLTPGSTYPCPNPYSTYYLDYSMGPYYPVGVYISSSSTCSGGNANYNTNYNVAYPIATQPLATQPATAWVTNYSTNYNVAYPIATRPEAARPITAYTPGNTGTATTVLGVYFPGGPIDLSGFSGPAGTASYVGETVVAYYSYPDQTNYPVAVPSGGQIVIKIE